MKLKRKESKLVVEYIINLQKQINELRKEFMELSNKVNEVESDVCNKQNKDALCTLSLHDPHKEAIEKLEIMNKKKKLTDIDIAWKEDGDSDFINKAESV